MTLLFSRAEIILFSTESSSFNEVRQLLSEGPSLKSWQRLRNDDSFPNDPRLEIQNWNPQKERKGAHNLMPSFMKGLLSRQCHCTSSQVSSGRSRIEQKPVCLMFLTWSYLTTWFFSCFFTPEISPAQGQRFDSCKVSPQWKRWDSKWNSKRAPGR